MKVPLHQLIEQNSKRIIDKFVSEARQHELPPRSLSHEQVADHLHRYLAEIVAVLRSGLADHIDSSRAAKQHGEQRWYVGYDLKSVILEYGLFRKVILDVVKESGGDLTVEDCDPLAQFIHVAIADAAVEFMENSVLEINKALKVAEQATEARDEVLAIVSHDLKNPLNVIAGSAALFADDLDTPDLSAKRPDLKKHLGRIQRASVSMDRLIHDLLDLGRIRAGELQLELQRHGVKDLLREALEQAAPLAEQRSVVLRVDPAPDMTILCDRERVLQVLANLIGNAIKFNRVGGTVTVRISCTPEECTFCVSDEGPGIPEERFAFLFDRYWRAPDTASKGTGLGLAIAKAFVVLHGGTIWCESEVGVGSTFFFKLPTQPAPLR
jgi:signal transduction histidine kinase